MHFPLAAVILSLAFSVNLSAHTPGQKTGSEVLEGTYDFEAENIAYLYLNSLGYANSYSRDILDDSKWGTIGTNQCKYVFLENSTLNRFDSHRGVTDLLIRDTVFGVKGLTIIGQKNFYGENIVFDKTPMPLQIRKDYGASWDGDMSLRM